MNLLFFVLLWLACEGKNNNGGHKWATHAALHANVETNALTLSCKDTCACAIADAHNKRLDCRRRCIGSVLSIDDEGLIIVDLSQNSLTYLSEDAFQNNINLTEIDLSENFLQNLPEGVFLGLTHLRTLNLSRNNFTYSDLPNRLFVDQSTNLRSLTWNEQTAYQRVAPPALCYLKSVSDMRMSGPAKIGAGACFLQMFNLEILRLDGPWCHMTDIKSYWPVELPSQKNSRTAGGTSSLVSIKILSIRNCGIQEADRHFLEKFSSLTTLDASVNNLSTFLSKDTRGLFFQKAHLLSKLNLSQNGLTTLPEQVFQGLTDLTELILSANRIHSLALPLLPDCKLNLLDLQNNEIKYIHPAARECTPTNGPFQLKLQGNNFTCQCQQEISEYNQWLISPRNDPIISNSDGFMCQNIKGVSVTYWYNERRQCSENKPLYMDARTYAVIILVISNICFMVCLSIALRKLCTGQQGQKKADTSQSRESLLQPKTELARQHSRIEVRAEQPASDSLDNDVEAMDRGQVQRTRMREEENDHKNISIRGGESDSERMNEQSSLKPACNIDRYGSPVPRHHGKP